MKDLIRQLVRDALADVPALESLPDGLDIDVERSRDASHGDFACNVAMRLAREARVSPRDLASAIVSALPRNEAVERVEIAGPGFINFFMSRTASFGVVAEVLEAGPRFGRAAEKSEPRILVEYVSANPTGPLHVGHGRHASFGASVSALLAAAGYPVQQEYYVNDHGRQMEILAVSVLIRLLERRGETVAMPAAGYQGDYIGDIAAGLDPERFAVSTAELLHGLPDDAPGGDKELHIDALIAAAQRLLGDEPFHALRRHALEAILDDIRDDLAAFGVVPDRWFSE
ncbi:MAG: arginine--tRNA ligase, partial [Pseudomonadota bacterium]